MPNSKTHSSWYQGNSSGEHRVNDLSQAKTYRIVGKNIPDLDLPKDVVTIGDGKNYVDLKKQNIEAGSRVIIDAHGGFSFGKSTLGLEEKGGFTSYAFQNLAAAAGGAGLNVEVFACHGGYAINNIVDLPKGSSLMTFIDDQDTILLSNDQFLQEASFKFQDPENQFIRFASYLLTSPHITKFAIRGDNGNHFFFCDPDSRESYRIDDIKLWQKDLLKEYAEFLSSIKEDLTTLNKAQIDKVIELVENEAELNQFIENFDTKQYIGDYLIGKADNNRVEEVKNILNKGADVNAVNKNGFSALYMAALQGDLELVKELLQHKYINVNAVNQWGSSALHIAAQKGHLGVIRELLLHKDIDVNIIASVIKTNQSTLLKAILQKNVEPKELGKFLQVALDINNLDMANQIIAKIIDQKSLGEALLKALHNNNVEIVETLLPKVTDQKSLGLALEISARNHHKEIFDVLLPKVTDQVYLVRALASSAENGHKEMFETLLPKVTEREYLTSSLAVSPYADKKILKHYLLKSGTDNEEIKDLLRQRLREVDPPIIDQLAQKFELLQEKFTDLAASLPQLPQHNVLNEVYNNFANQFSSSNAGIGDGQNLATERNNQPEKLEITQKLLGAIAAAGNYTYKYYKENYGKDASPKAIDEAKEMLSELLNSKIDTDKVYNYLNSCNDYLVHKLNDMYDKKTKDREEYEALREVLSQVSELKDNVLALENSIKGLKVARQELDDKSNVKKEQYVQGLIEEKKNLDDMCIKMMSQIENVGNSINQAKKTERARPNLEELVKQHNLDKMIEVSWGEMGAPSGSFTPHQKNDTKKARS